MLSTIRTTTGQLMPSCAAWTPYALTMAMPMVASEKGSPMMLPIANFLPPPKRPPLFISILLGESMSAKVFISSAGWYYSCDSDK